MYALPTKEEMNLAILVKGRSKDGKQIQASIPDWRKLKDYPGLTTEERRALIAYYWGDAPHCYEKVCALFCAANLGALIVEKYWRDRREKSRPMSTQQLIKALRVKSNKTLNRLCVKASVRVSDRGEKDREYTPGEVRAVFKLKIDQTKNPNVLASLKKFLVEYGH